MTGETTAAEGDTEKAIGVVVIGRNEGQRLVDCLESVAYLGATVVYVDSGSTDASVANAGKVGAEVVHLDLSRPFTAGRARNEGFERLLELRGDVEFVQFVDGDCQIEPGWIAAALEHLRANENAAIVCGQRKERYPDASIYNLVCDIEWDTPIGEAEACGGDFLARTEAFAAVGGFNPGLIAGEEPEMCYRLRRAGWKIHRIDRIMTHHDAAMTRLQQWAKRSTRSGYAYAAQAWLHARDRSGYLWRENARITFWAIAFPSAIAVLTALVHPAWSALLLAYPLQVLRCWRSTKSAHPQSPARAYALLLVLSKWTECYGQWKFLARKLLGLEQQIIEYK